MQELMLLEEVFSRKVLIKKEREARLKEVVKVQETKSSQKKTYQDLANKLDYYDDDVLLNMVDIINNFDEDVQKGDQVFIFARCYEKEIKEGKISHLPFFLNDVKTTEDKKDLINVIKQHQARRVK